MSPPPFHRYHEKCLKLFQNPKEIASAKRDNAAKSPELLALKYVSRSIRNLPDKSWSSVELHEMYKNQGGNEGNRSRFITKLKDDMNEEICFFLPRSCQYHYDAGKNIQFGKGRFRNRQRRY